MFPILNPPPSSLPIPSLWVIPVCQPQASCVFAFKEAVTPSSLYRLSWGGKYTVTLVGILRLFQTFPTCAAASPKSHSTCLLNAYCAGLICRHSRWAPGPGSPPLLHRERGEARATARPALSASGVFYRRRSSAEHSGGPMSTCCLRTEDVRWEKTAQPRCPLSLVPAFLRGRPPISGQGPSSLPGR